MSNRVTIMLSLIVVMLSVDMVLRGGAAPGGGFAAALLVVAAILMVQLSGQPGAGLAKIDLPAVVALVLGVAVVGVGISLLSIGDPVTPQASDRASAVGWRALAMEVIAFATVASALTAVGAQLIEQRGR